MSQRTGQWIELDEQFGHRSDEAGFVTLGLAQIVTTFAFWIGLWPEAFGIDHASRMALVLAVLFGIGGVLGFYLAFRAFALDPELQD